MKLFKLTNSRFFAIAMNYIISIALSAVLVSCSSATKTASEELAVFPVTNPIVKDTVYVSEYVSDIESRRHVEIRARVSGFIEEIYFDEGDVVKEGQPLFRVNNQSYKSELAKAQAVLKSTMAEAKTAEVELQNTTVLVEKGIISSTELEVSKARHEALLARTEEAESQVITAELNVSFTVVKSPFDGITDRIPHKVGSLIDEGTLLTSLADNERVYAYFNMAEREFLDIAENGDDLKSLSVSMILANGSLFSQQGKIEVVEGDIDKGTGTIAIRASFPNPDYVLRHGSSAKIQVARKLENALMIPQKSTFEIQDKTFVYVVDDNDIVSMRSVVPSFRLPHLYVIESGISAGERLIYEGIQLVKDGDQITPELLVQGKDVAQLGL